MNRAIRAAGLAIATSLAALATACNHTGTDTGLSNYTEVDYSCERGAQLRVRFFPGQETADLLRGDEVLSLPQQPTGSGFHYSNGKVGIRGKGEELLLEIGRMAPVRCTAL